MSSPSHSDHSPNLSEQLSIVEQLRSNPYHRAELAAAETVGNVLALFDETIDDSKAQLIADTYNIPLEKVNTIRTGEQATSIPQLARYMSLMGYNVCITLEKDD